MLICIETRPRLRYLCESVPSKAGLLLRVALLNDLAASSSHSTVQQGLAHALQVCFAQLSDVAYVFQPLDLDALAVALQLYITLKGEIGRIYLQTPFRQKNL